MTNQLTHLLKYCSVTLLLCLPLLTWAQNPTVVAENTEDGQVLLRAQGEGTIKWYRSDSTKLIQKTSYLLTPFLSEPVIYYVEDSVSSDDIRGVAIEVSATATGSLTLTPCATEFVEHIQALVGAANSQAKPLEERTNEDKLPCPGETGVGERITNLFSWVGPMNKNCNRVIYDDCHDADRDNYWISIVDDRRPTRNDIYNFGIIWGGAPGNYTYYGSCYADPNGFENEADSIPKLLKPAKDANGNGVVQGCVQNHVFRLQLFYVDNIDDSVQRVLIPKNDIASLSLPYLVDASEEIPTIAATTHGNTYSYGYVATDVVLKSGRAVRGYIVHNYGKPYFKWKTTPYQATIKVLEQTDNSAVPDNLEYNALVALYNATNGDNWQNNTNWLAGSSIEDIAAWQGITVENGDVVAINLRQNKLNGALPKEIGELKALEYLNLGISQIGTIPTEVGSLSSLTALYLDQTGLSSLPSSVGSLSSLEYLNLNDNNLTALPTTIGGLTKLKSLYLYQNQLSTLPAEIGDLSSLENLFLYQNPLTSLPEEIGQLSNLKGLFPKETQLTSLPESITQLTKLEWLNVENSKLDSLPDLSVLPMLKGVVVNNNFLTSIPDLSSHPNISNLIWGMKDNAIDLNLIAQGLTGPDQSAFKVYAYDPQRSSTDTVLVEDEAGTATLSPYEYVHPQSNFQWQRQVSGVWQDIAGATNATYTVQGEVEEILYRVQVSNNWLAGMSQHSSMFLLESTQYTPPAPPTVNNPPDATTSPTVSGTLTPASQSNSSVNYVRVFMPREIYKTPADVNMSTDVSDVTVSTEYQDGLGRSVQAVIRGGSNNAGQDLIRPTAYDVYGRQTKQYLPYAESGASGAFQPNAIADQYDFYTSESSPDGLSNVAQSDYPYAEMVYESFPSNRVVLQAAPGENWRIGSGHELETKYLVNTDSEVRKWTPSSNVSATTLSTAGYYSPGTLHKIVTVDENGYAVTEYTDKEGQTVLKRVQGPDGNQDTYYVYDDLNLLRFELPPEASKQLASNASLLSNANFVAQNLYIYTYDDRHRMTSKQVPGGGTTKMAYDQWDRLVASQTALQTENGQWSVTKYDRMNRPIMTGVVTNLVEPSTPQRYEEKLSGTVGYSLNRSYPVVSEADLRTVTYYDDYSFPHASEYTAGVSHRANVRGQVTGTLTRNLDNKKWLKSVIYYDEQQRPLVSISDNHLDGKDRILVTYRNRVNNDVLNITLEHQTDNSEHTVNKNYRYDHIGRLVNTTYQFDSEPAVTLSAYRYNAIGQLIEKQLGNAQQTIDYRYNIRGWLTRINDLDSDDTYFNQALYYDYGFEKKQHNGNIAGVKWNRAGGNAHAYGYLYDAVDRITGADYRPQTTTNDWAEQPGNFSVDKVAYDLNGNIQELKRYGEQQEKMYLWDNLEYKYNGNRLQSVNELSGGQLDVSFVDGVKETVEYGYDANGNLIQDKNKGITSTTYDPILNLPTQVAINQGTLRYSYDAVGTKLRQQAVPSDGSPTKTTDYVQGFQYEDGQLAFIHHEEGRLVFTKEGSPAGENLAYHYDLKDHLGNTRVTFSDKPITLTAMASMEMSAAPLEEAVFEGVAESRQTLAFHNTTDPSIAEPEPQQVATLMPGEQGPAKSLAVHSGDTIRLKVNARYETTPSQVQGLATEVAGALQKTASGLESSGASEGINGLGATGALANDQAETPQAYLNYLVYDEDYQLIDQGYQQVSEAAAVGVKNPDAAPEELALEVPIEEDGFVYAYLSNGVANNGTPVYFDDFTVEQQSYIVQVNDYYPFGGLHAQGADRQLVNNYLYQSQELTSNFGLDVYMFSLRPYDPALGRWLTVDPYEQFHSAYVGMGNNPIIGIDPTGGYTKFGAWIRAAFTPGVSTSDIYQSGGEWGFNVQNGQETTFKVGNYGEEGIQTSPFGWVWSNITYAQEQLARQQAGPASGAIEPFYFVDNPISVGADMVSQVQGGEYAMAAFTLVTLGKGGKYARWSRTRVKKTAEALQSGATSVKVANRSEAEELFLGLYQGHGYRNTTGMSATEAKNFFGKKAGTYHWDDVVDETGRLVEHGADNVHGAAKHLQIHGFDGKIIRISFD